MDVKQSKPLSLHKTLVKSRHFFRKYITYYISKCIECYRLLSLSCGWGRVRSSYTIQTRAEEISAAVWLDSVGDSASLAVCGRKQCGVECGVMVWRHVLHPGQAGHPGARLRLHMVHLSLSLSSRTLVLCPLSFCGGLSAACSMTQKISSGIWIECMCHLSMKTFKECVQCVWI